MAKQLVGNGNNTYTFDASAQTVQISGIDDLAVGQILLINNATRETIIYNPFSSGKGYTAFANGLLTLEYDTTSMADGDVLQIFYDNADEAKVSLSGIEVVLRRLLQLLERPLYYDPVNANLRVQLPTNQSLSTITSVSSVSAVTNLAQFDSIPGRIALNDPLQRNNWAQIRDRISLS